MRRRIAWVIVPFCWALACGGRFQQTGDGDSDGGTSTGQGGSAQPKAGTSNTGRAGTTSSGGSKQTGVGGKASGTSGSSPTATAGAPVISCDPIACGPNYMPVPDATGCYHCELDINSCELQRQSYVVFRDQMLGKYGSINCQVDTDCSLYFEKNACGTGCGVALANVGRKELESSLDAYALMACPPACPPPPQVPCGPIASPHCWKGSCE